MEGVWSEATARRRRSCSSAEPHSCGRYNSSTTRSRETTARRLLSSETPARRPFFQTTRKRVTKRLSSQAPSIVKRAAFWDGGGEVTTAATTPVDAASVAESISSSSSSSSSSHEFMQGVQPREQPWAGGLFNRMLQSPLRRWDGGRKAKRAASSLGRRRGYRKVTPPLDQMVVDQKLLARQPVVLQPALASLSVFETESLEQSTGVGSSNNDWVDDLEMNRADDIKLEDAAEKAAGDETDSLSRFWPRTVWLIALMIAQSLNSMILERFGDLIKHHPMVVVFLTVLLGAGGSAGGQSTILIVRMLATGELKRGQYLAAIWKQFVTGVGIAAVLGLVLFIRVVLLEPDFYEVLAVTFSMFAVTVVSVVIGAMLPLLFHIARVDSGHANAAVQVIVDILGVTLVCFISVFVLDRLVPLCDANYASRLAGFKVARGPEGQ